MFFHKSKKLTWFLKIMIYLIPSAFSTGNSFTEIEKYANFVDTSHTNVITEDVLHI